MEMTINLKGQAPGLLMHNAQYLTDPLSKQTKAMKQISGKKKKTDDDHIAMARIEFDASFYYAEGIGPYIPGINVERTFFKAGVITRQGTAVQRAVIVPEEYLPLLYKGPRTIDELWEAEAYDRRPVKVGQSTVIRTRPKFEDWELEVPVLLDESILNADDFIEIVHRAGRMIGLCDYRPRFGRFEATFA